MIRQAVLAGLLLTNILAVTATAATDDLAVGFRNPPDAARPWVYWYWLNGYVTREGIVRDLDVMQKQGIGGVLTMNGGGGWTPKRTEFLSPAWRELFRFAVEEAAKRGIEVSLNLCDGWNAGGPWVKTDDAARVLVYSGRRVIGPQASVGTPPPPASRDKSYRDIGLLAWRVAPARTQSSRPPCLSVTHIDLTGRMSADGSRLTWNMSEGEWQIIRFGSVMAPRAHTKLTGGRSYPEIDPLNAEAMDRHFAATASVVLQDVRPYVGKTFRYVHIDSGEIGNPNWTLRFREQFRRLRGYDPYPYFAAKAGWIVDDPATTERFLEDYERTIGDLMVECYYGRLGELAWRHGLGTHSEAAGFQKPTVDALGSLGSNDIAMSEFWSRGSVRGEDNYIHQLAAEQLRCHDGIKTASSAAHIYGRKIIQAEAYTVMRQLNFDRAPFDLKDVGDRAFCAGMNRAMLCFYVCQPEEQSKPGYQWLGVGMEFDRHVTWSPLSHGWLTYLARCQSLLQAGQFVADVCYLQGEWVPAYVPARWAMNPVLPPGYDCDTINAEALATRAHAGEDGRLVLTDGPSYRYLVLWQGGQWQNSSGSRPADSVPSRGTDSGKPLALSPATLRTIKELVAGGGTLLGPRPHRAIGLTGYPQSDAEVANLADELWGAAPAASGERRIGRGRVVWGRSLAEIMQADGVPSDLEIREEPGSAALPPSTLSGIPNRGSFDWIHRTIGGADVYFVANLRNAAAAGEFRFRAPDRQPELWDPVTGEIRVLAESRDQAGRTVVPMKFAPRQSFFVVFRKRVVRHAEKSENFPALVTVAELAGAWEVAFDRTWGGPDRVAFEKLDDWTKRPEEGIRHYSGKATYRKTFDVPQARLQGARLFLDLGVVKNVAAVRLNGRDLGIVWTAPWHVEITGAVKPSGNAIEVDVVNLWPNRLIGDASLPSGKRFTRTNVIGIRPDRPLLPSGLLGPVTLQRLCSSGSGTLPPR